jgi:hypothetical protein
MKVILHHNVGILITRVKTDRGNPYCVQMDSRSPHNTYPCARKETNQKIYGCDIILSVISEEGTLYLYGWFHSSHYFACCGSTCVLPNKQNSAKKIGANITVLCPFKYTIPMHTAFLSSAFCVMDEI